MSRCYRSDVGVEGFVVCATQGQASIMRLSRRVQLYAKLSTISETRVRVSVQHWRVECYFAV